MAGESRREVIRKIHKQYSWYYHVLMYMMVLAIGVFLGSNVFRDRDGYDINIWTEMLGVAAGAGVTVFVLDRFNERRVAEREKSELNARLRRQVKSSSHDIAIGAIEELRDRVLLTGDVGLLAGEDMNEAPLENARLSGANLQGTILENAMMRRARLVGANLREAILTEAKLHYARLMNAELQDAKCHSAKMANADLSSACCEDAKMEWICLEGAILHRTCFKGVDLHKAQLKGASLWETDFTGSDLTFAELRDAQNHKSANWEKAKLFSVDLEGVDFSEANMKEADLECAILKDADLWGTDLKGANLLGANLQGAKINPFDPPDESIFDGPEFEGVTVYSLGESRRTNLLGATLPDGTKFTEDTDYGYLRRFTNPSDEMLKALDVYCNRP